MYELTNPFIGDWTYCSFLNNPDLGPNPQVLPLFGFGTLTFTDAPMGQVKGTIGTVGSWMLDLEGWITYGDPYTARFQGKGIVQGAPWIYDYECYYVKHWPNGVDQIEALVGSVIRTIPHPGGEQAGLVASFYAVRPSPIVPSS